MAVSPTEINPGEKVRSQEVLTVNLGRMLPEPGVYTFQAVFYNLDRKEKVQSKLLIVKVKQPVTNKDMSAYQFIASSGNASSFFSGTNLINDFSELQTIAQFGLDFGDTDYGVYADFTLGQFYYTTHDYVKAYKHLLKLSTKRDFVFSNKVSRYLEKVKEKHPEIID
ncbi:MAG: hypothetical protein MSG64_07790 [Pyrinomonadaceae bacterium MAG19_C2-C3]|nr:hypothetical protein [Pyrinomonadaceae bacterium MAG19_C2-C3]